MNDDVQIEIDGPRLRATFHGEGVASRAACDALVDRIKREAPRAVQVLCDFASPGAAWPAALAGRRLPTVEAFVFDTFFQTQTRQSDNAIGDLSATLLACPSLGQLFATGALVLSPVEHGALRALHLLGDPITSELLAGLGASSFLRLERLALSLASDAGPVAGATTLALAALSSLRAPALREVHLDAVDSIEELIEQIDAHPPGRHWQTLTLNGSIEDEDRLVAAIEAHATALRSLATLALPLADYISTGGADRIRELLPNVADTSERTSATLPEVYAAWPTSGASAHG